MKLLRELREKNIYPIVEIVMSIPNEKYKLHCLNLEKEKYEKLIDIINELLSNVNMRTK